MDNWLIFQYNLFFVRAILEGNNFRSLKASAGWVRFLWTESGASSGVTRQDIQSVLMNSRASSKFMLFEVNPLEFASSDVKYFVFDGVILEISAAKKNLGSENVRLPYRKPTQVGRSSRPR